MSKFVTVTAARVLRPKVILNTDFIRSAREDSDGTVMLELAAPFGVTGAQIAIIETFAQLVLLLDADSAQN